MANSSSRSGRSPLGSKREVRPGVWEVRVSSGYRPDGGQRRVTERVHGDESDADAAIYRIANEMRRNVNLGIGTTLDAYFWTSFLPGRRATTTKANASTCESVYRCHIAPWFGDWKIEKIGNREIQRWIYTLPPQSAETYVRVMRTIMTQAHFDHLISENPMGGGYAFKLPRGRDTSPLPVWGPGEVEECRRRLRGHQLFAIWLVMVGSGVSRSEALALDWENFSFVEVLGMDGKVHSIAEAEVRGAYTAADGMKEPKNERRYRRIRIQAPFADDLAAMRASGPICTGRRGGAGWPPTISRRYGSACSGREARSKACPSSGSTACGRPMPRSCSSPASTARSSTPCRGARGTPGCSTRTTWPRTRTPSTRRAGRFLA